MIDLHFAGSANSLRVVMVLEECGLAYRGHKLDLAAADQQSPDYLRLNRFGTVPTIVDPDGPDGRGIVLAQSAAIMLYLAEKAGRLVPAPTRSRIEMMQWLMLAASDVAPANTMMLYMDRAVPDLSDAGRAFLADRFLRTMRGVDSHLAEQAWLCSDVSLADLALLPPVLMRRDLLEATGGFERVLDWMERLMGRPAIRRAIAIAPLPAV